MNRGFTIIEILISVAIFSIVMVVALGSLLAISAAGRKAETVKSVINNLDFALESMSRTIRTGVYYHCGTSAIPGSGELTPQDCISGSSYFVFRSNDPSLPYTVYCLSGNSIWRQKEASVANISTSCGTGNFLQMTAPEVKITSLTFYTNGSLIYPSGGSTLCNVPPANSDCVQPRVTITLNGYVAIGDAGSNQSTFNIQTMVVQRLYDQ